MYNLLQKLLETHIDYSEIDKRNIICGNAMNFQGDERDVIFLSMVDSNQKEKYLNLKNDGGDDAHKKRFNVATSRAKDQLWVVHSLDIDKDLKSDDIRKRLLEYSMNPSSYLYSHEKIERNADSPFEAEVAKKLNDKGYKISQQWEAGAYRIDIVVEDGLKKIALECDGEKYHSGEEKVREDMERQTILERSGWQFIRVRGSEYYRNPDGAMKRIVKELENYEIYPTNQHREDAITFKTNLLECIKQKADAIYEEEFKNVHSENKVYNPF
ncbi:MAG: AAA domain-containing protein [Erysipelotrichaceae bacterium]|nr:AAA domain-containing protein [Erysipelotrichaceae bacterium]